MRNSLSPLKFLAFTWIAIYVSAILRPKIHRASFQVSMDLRAANVIGRSLRTWARATTLAELHRSLPGVIRFASIAAKFL